MTIIIRRHGIDSTSACFSRIHIGGGCAARLIYVNRACGLVGCGGWAYYPAVAILEATEAGGAWCREYVFIDIDGSAREATPGEVGQAFCSREEEDGLPFLERLRSIR